MNTTNLPTANEQIGFLRSLQRLLDEGVFTSSYKFALLHAIADLCLVKGEDDGVELELFASEIAEQFVRLYWPQVVPYVIGSESGVLRQNTGRQAAIVREVAEQHAHFEGSLTKLEKSPSDWPKVRSTVEETVKDMPLWKLQRIASGRLNFLYDNVDSGGVICLKPGIAYCFRAFYPMVTDMIEGAWSHYVQRRNAGLFGQLVDLRSFLFGTQRGSLDRCRPLLRKVQRGRCFYCGHGIKSGGQVDHFIPWRLYALNLGHNFVLAHQGCNSSKSGLLAAEVHLERWTERNRTRRQELESGFEEDNVQHDLTATYNIARWAYGQVHRSGGQVWVRKRRNEKELKPLTKDDWQRILPMTTYGSP